MLTGTLTFVKQTSTLIDIFSDQRPFYTMQDERFDKQREVLEWFEAWREDIKKLPCSAEEKKRMFISTKCFFDVSSMIIGFRELCRVSFHLHPGCGVIGARVNSDLVENIFCQERAAQGQKENPTITDYGRLYSFPSMQQNT